VLEVMARITSADQKCHEIPAPEDEGLDVMSVRRWRDRVLGITTA
jgi:hypothetical protein